jgi:23S rRNA U2552 (ribose-2'-O)-methylase RlmE/FtsJ
MVQPMPTNPLKRLLMRSEACRVLNTLPSILRGSIRARGWKDSILKESRCASVQETVSGNLPNPLRTYFDSVTKGKGIWKWLHYFDIYQRHFQKFVGKEVRVVEVGIYSGGSLDMWKTYFGPKCMVYGVDIEEACKAYEDERTKVFVGDQADRSFWRHFREQVPHVDILIDDGGHLVEQQIVTLEEMLPHLQSGGVYLCEDVQGTHNRFASYVNGLATHLNALTLKEAEESTTVLACAFQRAISSVHLYPLVTVIEKACNPVDQLLSVKHGTEWQPFL